MLQDFRAQQITWDKANNNVYEKIEAHEGDSNGRKLVVQILNRGVVEDLTGTVLSLSWQSKSNFGLDAFQDVDLTKGLFEIYYTTEMLSNVGSLKASLVLVDVKGRIESKSFEIVVNRSTVDDDAVQSENSFTALTEALVKVSQYQAEIDDIKADITAQGDTLIAEQGQRMDNLHDTKESKMDELYSSKTTKLDTLHNTKEQELDTLRDTKSASLSNLEQEYEDKAENLETTYAPRLLDAENAIDENYQDFNSHLADYASLFTTNADAKNSIYRGKYLGSTVTTEQYTAISSGTFEDLYIGDYWTINGINWRIAAFNYYRNTGDTLVPGNHLVIVPDQSLYSHVMNDTNTTEGGYTGSKMYTEGLTQAKTIINNAFSGHVVTFRAHLCNAVTNGEASAGAWADSTVDLMNEIMVYGSVANGATTYGLYNIGTEKSQLPLFALNPQSINTRYSYWLRDVASASHFALVASAGSAGPNNAGGSYAVRPRFLIS